MSNEMNTQEEKKVLTQKDLNKAMFRWYMSAEMPLNFENMQGIAFCGSISHILKKLYTKKEDLSEEDDANIRKYWIPRQPFKNLN